MLSYDEALNYLSGLLRFGIKFGLDRFAELCRRMGNPQDALRVIHVGGTNGKGSTCVFIASILQSAGCTVGTYLSPYVYDVRERIQINGEPISKEDFAALMSEIAPHLEAVAASDLGQGTEFEAKTLMAFLYFARRKVDYAVIEVGMGGRYDCTNVVHPLVSVITNVSLDHTERLGETVKEIAWDKAGIAKPGAPLVTAADCGLSNCGLRIADCGFEETAWKTIHRTARDQGVESIWRVVHKEHRAPLGSPVPDVEVRFAGESGKVTIELPIAIRNPQSAIHNPQSTIRNERVGPVSLRLAGDFQLTNAATAAAAVAALPKSAIPNPQSAIEKGLTSAYLPGRLEVLRRRPTVVIDAAHNPDGAQNLAESVRKLFSYRRLILVVGMLETHSAEDVLLFLAPIADEVIATKPQWEKARPADDIADTARKYATKVRIIEPVPAAVRAALESASEDDLILITGSFYTIGEVDRASVTETEA